MAEVNLAIIAKENITSTFSAIEKSTHSLGKAFDYLKESSSALKYAEASVFADPKFWLNLAFYIGTAIKALWELRKENQIEKTAKSIESAVSQVKDLKSPVEELSGAMKILLEYLKPVKEHFESINSLISEIKRYENFISDQKRDLKNALFTPDFSELEGIIATAKKELSYRTGYEPTAFDGLDTPKAIKAIEELHEKIKEPISLNLDPENFFHNLQSAWDTFRNVRERIITPIALSLDTYIKEKMFSLPSETRHTVRVDRAIAEKGSKGNINFSPTINIYGTEGKSGRTLAEEIESVLAQRWRSDRSELKRAIS
ncbi:MAG: hypothetical protein HY805_00330 [Nitrospirae bacterium]|nr:hypothetical protein [Nitrospirota bacterium]